MAVKKRRKKKKKNDGHRWLFGVVIALLLPLGYGGYLSVEGGDWGRSQTGTGRNIRLTGSETEQLALPQMLVSRDETLVVHKGYTVSFNRQWRIPNWVSYELTGTETQGVEERTNHFTEDPELSGLTADNRDYYRSGYDRGHMAPAADMKWDKAAMKESFYYSNICPQHRLLNQRKWNDLEEQIRKWAVTDSALIVICGPVVESRNPKTIGKNKVVVPDAFFKVVLAPYAERPRAIGFLFRNAKATRDLTSYVVSVDSVEAVTGLDFFASLPDDVEQCIEAEKLDRGWIFN